MTEADTSMKYKLINPHTGPDLVHTNQRIAEFLHEHLEQYGVPVSDILKCLDYVFNPEKGGHVLLGLDEDGNIIGAVIINHTGMSGYIPENILVYIALHKEHRGKGLGKQLMKQVIKLTKGDIALHVEADNHARFLYEKVGFTNPYLEMRLKR